MLEDYRNALRAGLRACRASQAKGQSPYLAVLDDLLADEKIAAQEPLGLVEIPAESIVGTKTAGRHTAFAPNFMPLLDESTEFAHKWINLCDAHLEEGIHDPILAYEYMNKFYVQEGNKRVSVLKYYEAVKISGVVTRLIPEKNDTLENRIYYEFLDFYKLSRINNVLFSRLGGYAKLQTLVCKAAEEEWTEDDRLNFSALYTMFSQQFYALGGSALELTPGDAQPGAGESGKDLEGDRVCGGPRGGGAAAGACQGGQRTAAEPPEHLQPQARAAEGGVPARAQPGDQRLGARAGKGP